MARRLSPAAVDGCLGRRRYLPVRLQATKMVDAQQVELSELRANPLLPPCKTVGTHLVPSVMRIAPELTGGGEVVGRHAGDDFPPPFLVQLKSIATRPHVSAVVADEQRNIAEDQDAAIIGETFEGFPLPVKQKLFELALFEGSPILLSRRRQRFRMAVTQLDGPVEPGILLVGRTDSLIERIVIQPIFVLALKRRIGILLGGTVPLKSLIGFA